MLFLFIFEHLWALNSAWKIIHGGPGKSWSFLSVNEWEPCYLYCIVFSIRMSYDLEKNLRIMPYDFSRSFDLNIGLGRHLAAICVCWLSVNDCCLSDIAGYCILTPAFILV